MCTMMSTTVEISRAGGLEFVPMTNGKTNTDINWVQVAVEMIGGVQATARKLDVSREVIYKWMRRGTMRRFAYEDVIKLSKASGIPHEKLCR